MIKNLGEPFAVLAERTFKGEWLDFAGFRLDGEPELVVMVTDGLADLARRHGYADSNGDAQELVFVLHGACLNQATLDFFIQLATRHAEQHCQLGLFGLIRLGRAVPGSAGLRYLLSASPEIRGADLPAVADRAGTTTFCQLIPLHAEEAEQLPHLDNDEVSTLLGRLRPECANLHRQPMPPNTA
jgi:hypothetical protein